MVLTKKRLLRFPVFIIIHIALVAIIFKFVYPEVELSSLPLVIGGTGFCLAGITDYLYTKFFFKEEQRHDLEGESPDEK